MAGAESGDAVDHQTLELDIAQIRQALSSSIRQPVYDVYDGDEAGSDSGEEYDSDSDEDNKALFIDCPPAPPSSNLTQRSSAVSTSILSDGRTSETQVVTLDELDLHPTLENCLALNRVYQDLLNENIRQTELLLAANKERQQELQGEIDEAVRKNRPLRGAPVGKKNHSAMGVFTMPYFKDVQFLASPSNEDTVLLRKLHKYNPYIKPPKPWQKNERVDLVAAIKKNRLEILLRPLITRKENLSAKLTDVELKSPEKDGIKERIKAVNEEILKLGKLPRKFTSAVEGHDFDWMKLSNISFQGSRSPSDCELFWKNYENAEIYKGKWTKEESESLYKIASKFSFRDWDKIAATLNTKRTGLQCLHQYQTKLNKSFCKSKWTPADDTLLREVVESCRIGDYIPWHQVSYYMDHRTITQIVRRWKNGICPVLRKGKWEIEEEILLFLACKEYGSNWSTISAHIPGRTGSQIREKWYTTLNDEVSVAPWTNEEDFLIIQLVEEHGKKWSTIAKELLGRTDSMVMNRYNKCVWWINYITKRGVSEAAREDLEKIGHPPNIDRTKMKGRKYIVLNKLLSTVRNILPMSLAAKETTGEKALEALTQQQTETLITRLSSLIREDRSVHDAESKIVNRKKGQRRTKSVLDSTVTVRAPRAVDPLEEDILKFIMPSSQPNRRPREPTIKDETFEETILLFSNLLKAGETFGDGKELKIGTNEDEVPLLPPCYNTISAFRQLLLCRKVLETQCAGGWGQYVTALVPLDPTTDPDPGFVPATTEKERYRNKETDSFQHMPEDLGIRELELSKEKQVSNDVDGNIQDISNRPKIKTYTRKTIKSPKIQSSTPVSVPPFNSSSVNTVVSAQSGNSPLPSVIKPTTVSTLNAPFPVMLNPAAPSNINSPISNPTALPSSVIQAILKSIDPSLLIPGAHYRVVPPSPVVPPPNTPNIQIPRPPLKTPSSQVSNIHVASSNPHVKIAMVPQATSGKASMIRITTNNKKLSNGGVKITDVNELPPSQNTSTNSTSNDVLRPSISSVQSTQVNTQNENCHGEGITVINPTPKKRGRPRKSTRPVDPNLPSCSTDPPVPMPSHSHTNATAISSTDVDAQKENGHEDETTDTNQTPKKRGRPCKPKSPVVEPTDPPVQKKLGRPFNSRSYVPIPFTPSTKRKVPNRIDKPVRAVNKVGWDVHAKVVSEQLMDAGLAYTGKKRSYLRTSPRELDIADVEMNPEFQLLFARFVSIFFWPALLATVKLDPQEDKEKEFWANEEYRIPGHRPKQRRKRKFVRRPWVGERFRELHRQRAAAEGRVICQKTKDIKPKIPGLGRPFGAKNKRYDGPRRTSSRRSVRVNMEETNSTSEQEE